jgi:hypothetical protein
LIISSKHFKVALDNFVNGFFGLNYLCEEELTQCSANFWPIAKAIANATEDAIADFIFYEIYMHFDASQEILSDGGSSNLCGKVVETYLKKIQTVNKGSSPYHPRINGRVEHLNGIIDDMLTKLLLGFVGLQTS